MAQSPLSAEVITATAGRSKEERTIWEKAWKQSGEWIVVLIIPPGPWES